MKHKIGKVYIQPGECRDFNGKLNFIFHCKIVFAVGKPLDGQDINAVQDNTQGWDTQPVCMPRITDIAMKQPGY